MLQNRRYRGLVATLRVLQKGGGNAEVPRLRCRREMALSCFHGTAAKGGRRCGGPTEILLEEEKWPHDAAAEGGSR